MVRKKDLVAKTINLLGLICNAIVKDAQKSQSKPIMSLLMEMFQSVVLIIRSKMIVQFFGIKVAELKGDFVL
jgi:hypothetical protein